MTAQVVHGGLHISIVALNVSLRDERMACVTSKTVEHQIDPRRGQEANSINSKVQTAIEFAQQAERLGQYTPTQEDNSTGSTQAIEAHFVTAQDPVIRTVDGGRLPAVPIEEARKLNELKNILNDQDPSHAAPTEANIREAKDATIHGLLPKKEEEERDGQSDVPLGEAKAPWRTNPLFPPLPMYGPPTLGRRVQGWIFRISSGILSILFLLVIILGAAFTSLPLMFTHIWLRFTFRNPDKRRPFFEEEDRRKRARRIEEKLWKKHHVSHTETQPEDDEEGESAKEFVPLEGGPDLLKCDIRYYARRVGLDCEIFEVQTEDGFIIELWHLYNPRDYKRTKDNQRVPHAPVIFPDHGSVDGVASSQYPPGEKKYPVLMIHGLLQSAGAYCTNDDDSLAFFLAKSGYDVWLGNNRCGFNPRHTLLKYGDPRMWAWSELC